jgi:hypothetical protein
LVFSMMSRMLRSMYACSRGPSGLRQRNKIGQGQSDFVIERAFYEQVPWL